MEQPAASVSQARKRLASQSYRELPVDVSSPSQREHRQGSWFWCGCKWKPRPPRTGLLCKLLALMVGLLVVFHAASCGYFFCVQFPGARVLDFSRDIYDDFRDIYALAGGGLFACCLGRVRYFPATPNHSIGVTGKEMCRSLWRSWVQMVFECRIRQG